MPTAAVGIGMEPAALPPESTAWWRRRRVLAALAVAAALLLAGLLGALVPSRACPGDGRAKAESVITFSVSSVHGPATGSSSMGGQAAAAAGVLEIQSDVDAGATAAAHAPAAAAAAAVDPQYESMFPAAASLSSPLFSGAVLQKDQQRPAVGGASRKGLLGLSTCVAKTGADVDKAIHGADCTVILLGGGFLTDYKITRVLNVTAHKVIIGNPIDLPALNATNRIERLFNVLPGGRLNLRAVQLFRGGGRSLLNGRVRLAVGTAIKVYPGGLVHGAGVIFREARSTLQGFLNDLRDPTVARRTFGGMVMVAGGDFTCHGCHIVRFNPYGSPSINSVTVGGNFLVLLGTLTCTGCYNIGFNLFSSGINVGGNAAVMGGSLNWIGGGGSSATCAVGQFGAGQNTFVGGGVLVFVGFQDISTVLALCRAGFGQQAVGAGVLQMIGHNEDRSWAVGSVANAGQTYSVGSGILQMHGGQIMNFQVSLLQVVNGGSGFVGSGDLGYIGMTYGTFGVSFSQHGLGMRWSSNAGLLENILISGVSTAVVRVQYILGSESYLGTGFFSSINQTRYSIQLVNAAFGGHEYWVGPGAAAFIKTYSFTTRLINYRTNPYSWVAAGTYVAGSYKATNTTPAVVTNRGGSVYVNKTGVYAVSKEDGLVLLPPVLPPTRQAEKMMRRNESVPHVGTPIEDLPHHIDTPGAGNSGPDDPFMHASLPSLDGDDVPAPAPAPSPSPRRAAAPTTPTSVLVVDSRIESVKAPPPKAGVFQKALRRERLRRERRLAESSSSSGRARVLQPVLGKWSPLDVMAAFKASERAAGGGGGGHEEGRPKEYWPEYVYTRGADQCLLCGLHPLPTSSHISPTDEPLDVEWWLEPNATTTATTGATRRAQTADSSPSTGSCTYSDACAGAATPQEAIALAAGLSPDPLPFVPGLQALEAMHKTSATNFPLRGSGDTRGRRRRLAATGATAGGEGSSGGGDYSVKLPDTMLFQQKLTVHCSAEGGPRCGLTERAIKAAFKEYVAGRTSRFPVGADPSYKLTAAYADALPEAVLEALDPEEDVGDAALLTEVAPRRLSETCPRAAAFTVFVLARDAETGKGLRGLFSELAADVEGLLGVVTQANGTTAFCEAGMAETGALALPSIDTPAGVAFYQNQFVLGGGGDGSVGSGRSLFAFGNGPVWPSVLLLDPTSVAPVGAVRMGAAYRVVVAGFRDCPGEVAVELVQGLRADGPVLAMVSPPGTAGDDGDRIEVEWTPKPSDRQDDGGQRFFLYAWCSALPHIFSFSTPFLWRDP